jgi:hypothetical protein
MMDAQSELTQYWEDKHLGQICKALVPGDLILAYNRALETQWGQLFANLWNGPYWVVCQVQGGLYVLEEFMDGVELKRRFAADQVKRFQVRGGMTDQK